MYPGGGGIEVLTTGQSEAVRVILSSHGSDFSTNAEKEQDEVKRNGR
jgi:hypothetical protein